MAEIGSRGGKIGGPKGFMVTCARYFGGDRAKFAEVLRQRAEEKQIAKLAQEEMARTGETCMELPVLCDPEDDGFFEEATRWVTRVAMSKKPKLNEVDIPF